MSFNYTEEQQMIKDMVHDFAEKEVKPKAPESRLLEIMQQKVWGFFGAPPPDC